MQKKKKIIILIHLKQSEEEFEKIHKSIEKKK